MSGDDIQFMKQKIDFLCEGMECLKKAQEKADTERTIILTALVGNDYGTSGLVKRMTEQETKHADLDRKMIRWSGIVMGLSIAFGFAKDWLSGVVHLKQ